MIDFAKNVCTPAKVYFILSILIASFSFFSGKFLEIVKSKNKELKKSQETLKSLQKMILFVYIFSIIFITLLTLIFNYFCSLGYVNIVGGVVFLLIAYRFYTLFMKGM